ncbi:MAG: hypothetical protein U0791_14620 [Gemmataceae bacterium]
MSGPGRNEPKRIRRSIHANGRHLGYVTLVAYPGRDITAFTEGSPYREAVISDEREGHVALLQRFKAHWLVQCGREYGTTSRPIDMTEPLAIALATLALQSGERGEPLVTRLVCALDDIS